MRIIKLTTVIMFDLVAVLHCSASVEANKTLLNAMFEALLSQRKSDNLVGVKVHADGLALAYL